MWRGPATSRPPDLAVVLAALILVTTPVQPWYAVTVAGLGALAGLPWLVVLGLAAEPYYAAIILADPHQSRPARIGYGAPSTHIAFGLFVVRRGADARGPPSPAAPADGRTAPVPRPHRPG